MSSPRGAFGGYDGLCLASGVFWGFLRHGVCKEVIEAFEEDTGLKVGSGVAESGEEEEDEDHQVGENRFLHRADGRPMYSVEMIQ
ncbi:hypothetical protein THAOC_25741, partial [Thalassiosira oceanica]